MTALSTRPRLDGERIAGHLQRIQGAANLGRRCDDVTVAIKTFERPLTLRRAVRSIQRWYPRMPVLIADDSESAEPIARDGVTTIRLPFDVGISAGRNELLRRTESRYVFIMDDDCLFIPSTRIALMQRLMEQYDLDILACSQYEPLRSRRRFFKRGWGRTRNDFETNIDLSDRTLSWRPGHHFQDENVTRCDLVMNGFLARREPLVEIGGWADELKIAEHIEFFLRAKREGLRVGYTERSRLLHKSLMSERRAPSYRDFRTRTPEFRKRWLEMDGIDWVVRADGSRWTADEYVDVSIW